MEPPSHDEGGGPTADRRRALELVHRHGRASIALQTLARGLSYFFDGDDAFVAYADTRGAWVAAGPPVAPPGREVEVAARFVAAAAAAGRRARLFGVDAGFADAAGLARTRVGEEPVWDPRAWPETLRGVRSLREQLRRARAKGVTTRVLEVSELSEGAPLRPELEALGARWLASRRMAPMGFLVQLDPFRLPEERIYIVAERQGRVMELLVASPVPARDGWLVEHVLRDPAAPNGTTELLVDALMRHAAELGASHVSLGLAPLGGPISRTLRIARRLGRPLYNFDGLRAFKAKLRPEHWEPQYLAYPHGERGFVAVLDLLHAFADGGFARFAGRTLLHLWRPITWTLGALLALCAVLLALVPGQWFPAPWAQAAWVGFDVVLLVLMLALLRRYRRPLVAVLSVLTGLDAVLSLAQAATYDLPRASHPLEHLAIAAAVLAPAMVFAFFAALSRNPSPP